jgi:replicative DNA helicase
LEPGVSTGLRDLDRAIGGLQPGRLTILAGRPGMGKSLVGGNIARAVAAAGYGCVFHSMEMGKEEIGARIIADQAFTRDSPISSKAIFEGALRPQHREMVERAAEAVAALPLVLDTTSNLSVAEIIARARRTADEMKARGQRLHVVVLDYLKFIKASERYRGQRHYEVGEITAGLKSLAKDLNICVVMLAQLNRAVETRADKRPELSDLRESGDIEADADVVLLLFREAYYLKDKTDAESQARLMCCENDLEIIVAKSRMGAVGTVRVFCHPAASAIRNWS